MSYRIEVWNKSGSCLGDIRHLAHNLKWTEQRNAAETVSFDMDLGEYEAYLKKINMTPYDFMDSAVTDIRLVRDGVERIGAHVVKLHYTPDDPSVKVEVSCTGYLNYFKDAFVDVSQNDVDQGEILWRVIDQYQKKPYGDFGIRKGDYVSRGMKRQRNQVRARVKDFIVRMTNVIKGPDIQFTPDKKFNTYDAMGSYRPDIRLIWPGNVSSFDFERSAASLANHIIAIGSGNGDDAIMTTSEDADCMRAQYRREKLVTFNSVEHMDTLQQNADGVREVAKHIYELPVLTVQNDVLDLNVLHVGDTVYAELNGYEVFNHIRGNYRIEKLEVSVDDNDSERPTITFDDIDIDKIIEQQEAETGT